MALGGCCCSCHFGGCPCIFNANLTKCCGISVKMLLNVFHAFSQKAAGTADAEVKFAIELIEMFGSEMND